MSNHHSTKRHHRRCGPRRFFRTLLLLLGLLFLLNIARSSGYHAGWQEGFYFAQISADGAAPALAYNYAPHANTGFTFFGIIGGFLKFILFFFLFATAAKFIGRRLAWAHKHNHGQWNNHHNHSWHSHKPAWWGADHPDRDTSTTTNPDDADDPIPPHKVA
ncbi:MAG TPA: hypothetical protein VLL52_04145 [Anaerolineae bacterium]|nr:hypothetical protein [Anaerolineae bacterium]